MPRFANCESAEGFSSGSGSQSKISRPELARARLTNDGVQAYRWDESERLIEVKDLRTSEVLVRNRYDGLGRRRERVQRVDGAMVTNRYVYDGWLVVGVLDGENNVLETYTHGPDLSGTREGAGGIGGLLSCATGTTNHWFHYDGNGNVVRVTDSEGAIVSRMEYDPFGTVLLADGDFTPRFQFSSKEYDTATGLNYYGYRYYSAALGRWPNRDPIGEDGGLNLYGFVKNDPTKSLDPRGRNCVTISSHGVGPITEDCNDTGAPRLRWQLEFAMFHGGRGPPSCWCHCEEVEIQDERCVRTQQWRTVIECDSTDYCGRTNRIRLDITLPRELSRETRIKSVRKTGNRTSIANPVLSKAQCSISCLGKCAGLN